jgi:dCTP deaminase
MGVYSNTEILAAHNEGHITIHPFVPEHVNGSSVDVTLSEWFYHSGNGNDEYAEDRLYNPYDPDDVKRHFGEVMRAEPLSEHHRILKRLGVTGLKPLIGIPPEHPVIILRPHERILAHTHEFIGIKPPGTTSMQARSTTGRNGVVVCMDAGWGDPGYDNRWTMEVKNMNEQYTVVPVGIRIAQIVFHHTGPVDGEYSTLSGKYQTTKASLEMNVRNWRPESMLPKAYQDKIELPPSVGVEYGPNGIRFGKYSDE